MLKKMFFILFPHRYYSDLCVKFGHPEDVSKELNKTTGFLKLRLIPYIKRVEKDSRDNYKCYLRNRMEAEIANKNRCASCAWGDGEGGCTSGDHCPERGGKTYE